LECRRPQLSRTLQALLCCLALATCFLSRQARTQPLGEAHDSIDMFPKTANVNLLRSLLHDTGFQVHEFWEGGRVVRRQRVYEVRSEAFSVLTWGYKVAQPPLQEPLPLTPTPPAK